MAILAFQKPDKVVMLEADNFFGKFEFRPVGKGVQDFPAILAASKEIGAKWVVVEQDQPCCGWTPMECAKMSIDYLNSL